MADQQKEWPFVIEHASMICAWIPIQGPEKAVKDGINSLFRELSIFLLNRGQGDLAVDMLKMYEVEEGEYPAGISDFIEQRGKPSSGKGCL